ncbi:Regulator of nonsense transcripts like [Heracleum sosnowskyi]|uniref:Regulator of nonsense transcripts like n=1 Tax=Heracleum sosnowskyi TaxID=360622 RepID=A0AAD8JG45_9APIA|nr:Regulator of nonsense transcripts like [Heracleum sosnowskyi]
MGSRMKSAADRTKVVVRHLPPTITEVMLLEQIDEKFTRRFKFVSFRPGNNSQRHQSYSRAYIDFQRPEDVIEFAEYFGGHVFVNEKGTQFKTVVEYAPSQRVPKQWSKKDGREGTIHKDPEYLEFLEFIAKPVENLPSAEIQLERRDAERAGAVKDAPVVTPLMDFIRQKRAAKAGSRRSVSNGKPDRRTSGTSSASTSSASLKRGSDKRRTSNAMYVLRDTSKSSGGKDKSAYVIVPKKKDEQISEKSISVAAAGSEFSSESGVPGSSDIGKKKILLLKGKGKEVSHVTSGLPLQQTSASPNKNSVIGNAPRQNNRHDASGRIIKSILLHKDSRQNPSTLPSEMPIQVRVQEKDKRPPRASNVQLHRKDTNEAAEDRTAGNDIQGFYTEKPEKRTRNKDRPDRGVWTPLRRSDGLHASNESLSSSASQHTASLLDTSEGTHGETKNDMTSGRSGDYRSSGRGGHLSVDNGFYKQSSRRGPVQNGKDADGSLNLGEAKPLKRGNFSGHGSQEKQVWVQKSSSGS